MFISLRPSWSELFWAPWLIPFCFVCLFFNFMSSLLSKLSLCIGNTLGSFLTQLIISCLFCIMWPGDFCLYSMLFWFVSDISLYLVLYLVPFYLFPQSFNLFLLLELFLPFIFLLLVCDKILPSTLGYIGQALIWIAILGVFYYHFWQR